MPLNTTLFEYEYISSIYTPIVVCKLCMQLAFAFLEVFGLDKFDLISVAIGILLWPSLLLKNKKVLMAYHNTILNSNYRYRFF